MSVHPIPEPSPAELFAETMAGHVHGAAVTMTAERLAADLFNAHYYATKGTLS